jgi:hypothetical protein
LLAVLVVVICLSPGLFWRDAGARLQGPQPLTIRPLALPENGRLAPGLTVAGVWRLDSSSEDFGGYSALLTLPGGELLALSDRGRLLRFSPPDMRPSTPRMRPIGAADDRDKRLFDIESATRDPASGAIWLGYEGRNAIRRFDAGLTAYREVRPVEMRRWPSNRGPESLLRLRDGRFIVLSEALGAGQPPFSEGLLFPGDPIEGAAATVFRFAPPAGFRPTDIAQLPDGRVVILLRRLVLAWPPVSSRLVVADPRSIRSGEAWRWRALAEISAPLPNENYEGLAIEPRADGAVRLWLISDNNSSVLLQRTLLLALDWTAEHAPSAQAAKR